jgi:hypothetical protein
VPKRSQVDAEFRRHVCERIDAYIREHNITDVAAANVLGVRKQMIGPYRRGESLPGTEAMARACIHWSLRFSYLGREISANDFPAQNGRPKLVEHQLELPFDEPVAFKGLSQRVQGVQLTITLKRVS